MKEKRKRKLIPLQRIQGSGPLTQDPPQRREQKRNLPLLMEAMGCYNNMQEYREERNRCKRYVFGDQWGDYIRVNGRVVKEQDYITEQGNLPFKNNFIGRTIRNVVGIMRKQMKEPTCLSRDREEQVFGESMSTMLQYNGQINQMQDLRAMNFRELLIGGFVINRKWFGWRGNKCDAWTDFVQPNNAFIDSKMRDFRGWDVSLIGEIHDISFNSLLNQFAMTPGDVEYFKELYRVASQRNGFVTRWHQFGGKSDIDVSFFVPSDEGLCRVIEVWRKESKPRYQCHDPLRGEYYKVEESDFADMVEAENASRLAQGAEEGLAEEDIPLIENRWFMDEHWRYYYLTPFGDVLAEGETPYAHNEHPYVFRMYPFVDGEIHPFVSDFIDQQRFINRMVILFEWVIRSSAKGVLLVPEDCIPEDSSLEAFAEAWTKFDGVIAIKSKPGVPLPQQVATNSTNIGIMEMLNLQMKFFEDISGVNGAMQGKPGYSGMSASLYAQQAQNASTSLVDILDNFSGFVIAGAYKDVKIMQQFYDDKRIENIVGEKGLSLQGKRNIQDIRDIEFDLSLVESTTSPVYRQIANDFLMQIWAQGQITLEQLLEVGDFPFGDQLLQSVKANTERLQSGQEMQMNPGLMQQLQSGANMQAVVQAQQMLSR